MELFVLNPFSSSTLNGGSGDVEEDGFSILKTDGYGAADYSRSDEVYRRPIEFQWRCTTPTVMNLPFSIQNLLLQENVQEVSLSVWWLLFIPASEVIGTPTVIHSQAWCACFHVHVFFTPDHPL